MTTIVALAASKNFGLIATPYRFVVEVLMPRILYLLTKLKAIQHNFA
ncbi:MULTISPECIES: hypothetical protein [Cyanophyceae]|nr:MULTISPECIES: hypothetical protein [Cyanophyceae]MDB9349385.1 hypothetical protein [Nodularia spumigena CS-588/01]MDB9355107.1 hypothetical protein [Nodularia spumigena CS-587/03]MDB9304721.1 hypothetical protein [Nodularia spumigena CS-591/12]MDB9323170.1 hypothetical protein [Nodularia spumigena CS-591/07A]MDB9329526.1 hypothetical protein [Nodularia spumigena CS-591/04]